MILTMMLLAAEEYGKKRKAELGKGYWHHVTVD